MKARNPLAVSAAATLALLVMVAITVGQSADKPVAGEWSQWRGPARNGISAETGWVPKWPGEWPQWRGPARNGISTETGWLAKWPADGPKVAWTKNVGAGYSAVSVSGGRVYTMGNANKTDTVWCLDADDGKTIWKQSYACRKGKYPGPRSTPTVDGDRVYTLSRQGHVFCFSADKGKKVWSKNLARELGIKPPGWGFAGSPLVEGNLLILNVGTAGVALNKTTGKVVWQTGTDKSGFSSPVLFEMDGKRCVLIFAAKGLACVDVETGRKLWVVPWKTSWDVHAADPVVSGNKIFITSGYGSGCALLQVEGGKPSVVWRGKQISGHFSSCVLYKGHLYGVDGNAGRKCIVKCVDFATGRVKWATAVAGMASLMIADGKLIIMADGGSVAVADAVPGKFKAISQAKVLSGSCWTMPVLAGGKIYCRNNHKGQLICLDVKAE